VTLQAGKPRPGNIALIAAGTGLGEALLIWDGRTHVVVASEGGHSDFAPRTDEENRAAEVSPEGVRPCFLQRILAGPGFFQRSTASSGDTGRYPSRPG